VIRIFAALKWRLVLNGLFRTRLGFLGVVGAVFGFGFAGVLALGIAATARAPSSATEFRAAGLGTYLALFGAWVFGPLLVGVDETVDPNRLALVPLTGRDLRHGLVAASLIGFGPSAAAIVLAGVVVGFASADGDGVLVVVATVVGFAFALTCSRALATGLARVQRSRRGRDISVVVAALTGAALWLGTQLAPNLSSSTQEKLFDALQYTPPGIVGQAIVDAGSGRTVAALVGIVLGAGFVVLATWAWVAGASRLLVDSGAAVSHVGARSAAVAGDAWLRGSAALVSARKELRYLVRSPARRSATIVAIALGTGFVLFQVLQRGDPGPYTVLLAPLGGFFAVSSINNQLGHDGASVWLEVVAGGPRRAELVGRSVSWLPALVAPSACVAIALGVVSGGWSLVPFAVLLAAAIAGVPLGVGTFMSVLAPIVVPDDSNPFTNRNANTGQGCLAGVVALAALLLDALLLLPVVVAVVLAADAGLPALALTIVPIALYAVAVWAAGATLAARRLRGREPELLVALSPRI
jgi:ABC-2 type transport system permease protein